MQASSFAHKRVTCLLIGDIFPKVTILLRQPEVVDVAELGVVAFPRPHVVTTLKATREPSGEARATRMHDSNLILQSWHTKGTLKKNTKSIQTDSLFFGNSTVVNFMTLGGLLE